MSKGMTPVVHIGEKHTLPLTKRFRVPGGTVTHRAAIVGGDDGFYVWLMCDLSFIRWLAWSEDERLDLIQPEDADVSCVGCERSYAALSKKHEVAT